jgi:RNA polymerase sigma factor (sigma-70 family)
MTDAIDDFRSLMECVRQGSDDAAWQLVDRYGEALRRAVRRALNDKLRSKFDSLDFVQIVWKSFFAKRVSVDRFQAPEDLAAFLVAMARNKVRMEIRRRFRAERYDVSRERRLTPPNDGPGLDVPDKQPGPMEVVIARERWNMMLHEQPPHYRRIIQLRLQGYTNQEIADALNLDERTVRRFLKRLLKATAA